MNEPSWMRIEALFHAAMAYPEAERQAFVARACGKDRALHARVVALLASDDADGGVLDRPIGDAATMLGDMGTIQLPDDARIGPYRLLRELGTGGASSVWLAMREDGYRRQVAIKLVQLRLAGADQKRRWRMEQQILASLEHPNIARLYDAGVTEDGHGYLVMEHVEGADIVTYCDRHRLTLGARIDLLCTLCEAVTYAHQNLVLHRDIKPSNVLVTEDGVPKLLDFGIAKIMNPHLVDASVPPTLPWQRLLTPDFASPEQLRGRAVTTATDVYSLGVVLFELLTGHRPFRLAGRTVTEIERILCDETAPRPSDVMRLGAWPTGEDGASDPAAAARARRGTSERLARRLRGDLDTIVGVALRKEPHRRYPTVDRLADDLRRYRRGLPVTARRSTLGYRARRFARRHRGGVAAAALVMLLVAAAGAALTLQSLQLARQRDRAEAARDEAVRVVTVLEQLLESSDPNRAGSRTMAVERLLAESARHAEEGLEGAPEAQADVLLVIGRQYRRRGLYAEALPLLERAHANRLASTRTGAIARAEVQAELARVRMLEGELEVAETLQREVVARYAGHFGAGHPETALVIKDLAQTLEERGAYAEAEVLIRRALVIEETRADARPTSRARSLNQLAGILLEQGHFHDAVALHRRALAAACAAFGERSVEAARVWNGLGVSLKEIDDRKGAERAIRESLSIQEQVLGREHPEVLANLNNLASIFTRWQAFAKAEVIYRDAYERALVSLGRDHPNLSFLLNGIGRCRTAQGDPTGAEEALRQALGIRLGVFPDDHPLVAKSRLLLADALIAQRRFAEAEPLMVDAHRVIVAQEPRRERDLRRALKQLVTLYDGWGRAVDAERHRTALAALVNAD